jgi:hypothetical protein
MDLLHLPTCLIANILSLWVEVHDVGKLDTAFCNRGQRSVLLTILQSTEAVVERSGCEYGYTHPNIWMNWHSQRKVKASTIIFAVLHSKDCSGEAMARFIAAVGGGHVKAVSFQDLSGDLRPLFCMLAVTCPSIKDIRVEQCMKLHGINVLVQCSSATLRSVSIKDCILDTAEIEGLHLPNLERLELDGFFDTDLALNCLRSSNRLTALSIVTVAFTDSCLEAIETHADRLTWLDLVTSRHNAKRVSAAVLTRLGSRCRNLRHLNLTIPKSAKSVVPSFLIAAPQLDTLGLIGVEADLALDAVALYCGSRLRHLRIELEEAELSEGGFSSLARHCTALVSLCWLGISDGPNDQALNLMRVQKGLRSMDFTNVPIADTFLRTLADKCPQLQEIILNEASGYTVAGVVRLVRGCKHLQHIQVYSDEEVITEQVRARCQSINPRLKFEQSLVGQSCWQF